MPNSTRLEQTSAKQLLMPPRRTPTDPHRKVKEATVQALRQQPTPERRAVLNRILRLSAERYSLLELRRQVLSRPWSTARTLESNSLLLSARDSLNRMLAMYSETSVRQVRQVTPLIPDAVRNLRGTSDTARFRRAEVERKLRLLDRDFHRHNAEYAEDEDGPSGRNLSPDEYVVERRRLEAALRELV